MQNIYQEKKISWLKGFFDGEGGLQYSRYKMPRQWHTTKRIAVTNSAIENIKKVRECLKSLKIDFRESYYDKRKEKWKPLYVIIIERKEAVKKFAKLIGFTEKRKQKLLNKILNSFDNRYKPSKKELENLYINKEMSTNKIAKKFGFSASAVAIWLQKYKIKTRVSSEWMKLVWKRRKDERN